MPIRRGWAGSPQGARSLWAGVVLALAAGPTVAHAQYGTQNGEWRYVHGDAGSTKYAPLDQINRDNVQDLQIAWRWKTDNFGPEPEYNARMTPLMVNGVLYTTAGYRRAVAAIDASTGETLWVYRMQETEVRTRSAPRRNSGRGVAYWTDGVQERILLITPGYHLVALNAKTGLPIDGFGNEGAVDLRVGLDRPLVKVDRDNDDIGSSSPPIVVGNVIVVGTAFLAGGAPPSPAKAPGWVRGYDVMTGALRWTFHSIPQGGEFGSETWERESWAYSGNGGVWTTMSADQELGYVYLPMEDPTADYYGGHRPGDNLFSSGIVCLDARTGQRVWHFQFIHHDIWDYDVPAAPILLDVNVGGRTIKAVAQVTKQAFTYVFDRVTGEPVWPIVERPVPQTDVPGEQTSATQPFPTKPPAFDLQGYSEDYLIDFTPELRAEALEIVRQVRTGPIYTPPVVIDRAEGGVKGTLTIPQVTGGANWQGAAVDAENGILFVPSVTDAGIIGLVPGSEQQSTMDYVRGQGLRMRGAGGPQGLPLLRPPWGRITAIDLNQGEILWQIPNGDTPDYVKNHPALQGLDIPPTGRPERGGQLVTKTLFFAGEGGGMFATGPGSGGNKFRAYDKFTGELIHEMELPANQTGGPMSYMVGDKQYIVVTIGAPGHPAELVALTLP